MASGHSSRHARCATSVRIAGVGNVLVRIEPEASIIAEGLEAFACGRLQSKAELARWLNEQPDFGKGRRTRITNQQAHDILTNFLYGGVVEKAEWGVSRRKGRHTGLVSYETFERIQERIAAKDRAPVRADLSEDFPLRGNVSCAHCGKPLTACWSRSKTGAQHPYYMCFARECTEYRKSIRRDQIEGEFEALLGQLTPSPKLIEIAKAMFADAWGQRAERVAAMAKAVEREIVQLDRQIGTMLDRIVEASSATVIGAFEKRIGELESSKLVLREKQARQNEKKGTFDEMFELAFDFLANPSRLWVSGRLEYRKLVLRLTFADRLSYARNGGFRTPKTTMPFSMLGGPMSPFEMMAERETGHLWLFPRLSRPTCARTDRRTDVRAKWRLIGNASVSATPQWKHFPSPQCWGRASIELPRAGHPYFQCVDPA